MPLSTAAVRRPTSALAEAIEIYGAPLADEVAVGAGDDELSFTDASERRSRATEALDKVGGVGAGVAADVADLLRADIALQDGDTETARAIWEKFLKSHSDHVLALSVRLNLIHLDRASGEEAAVATNLEAELDKPNKTLPEDVILFELAQTREALGEEQEALTLYQRILDEHPQSPYTGPARRVTTSAGS